MKTGAFGTTTHAFSTPCTFDQPYLLNDILSNPFCEKNILVQTRAYKFDVLYCIENL